ncbi:uncharacterized protein LOC135709549 [Ochlerotatus camptorhynchus]|uniref:uncharacterized protein LOC135709549 n=1 Tax=Ochlerotatus camptorhynchus TaxID=644619 RepID=UPI0031DBA065
MKSFIVALFCISSAFGDVSELFHQHDSLAHHLREQNQHGETFILVENPVATEFGLPNGNGHFEIIEVQHNEAHADYQGPYHYEKPKVQLEYVTPVPTLEVLSPIFKDQPNVYLPPNHGADSLVKRHAKYIARRRV